MRQTGDDLIDLLVVILLGVIGAVIAFLGLYLDTTIIYLLGMAILVTIVLSSLVKVIDSIHGLINTILSFKNHFRNRHP